LWWQNQKCHSRACYLTRHLSKKSRLKRHGGIVGLSQDEGALDRLVTITPHLAQIVQQYLTAFNATDGGEQSEHYQLTGGVVVRTTANAAKLRDAITLRCAGNPFKEKMPLKSLTSSILIPDEAKTDILHFSVKHFHRRNRNILRPSSKTGCCQHQNSQFGLALSPGMWSDPSTAQIERGTTDISHSPMVSSSFGIRSGRLPSMIRNLPSSSRSLRSFITLSPTRSLVFCIQLQKVFSFYFFIESHMIVRLH